MSAPPSIPQARSYLFKQRSEYTEYNMGKGTKIRINIPRLQRTYLSKDSYLRFRLNVDVDTPPATRNGALYLDRCGAYSLFDRIEVYDYLGGTLIEQVNNLPALMTMIQDVSTPMESFNGKLQSTQGYQGSMIGINSNSIETYELRTSNSGQTLFPIYYNAGGVTVGKQYASFEFSIPLPSFLGNFSSKFVPLHNGFSVDIYLNNVNQSFISYGCNQTTPAEPPLPPFYVGTTSATRSSFDTIGQLPIIDAWITNAELCAQVMELGNDAENLVLASNGSGPLVIPSTFYRYFTDLVKGNGENDQGSTFGMDLNLNVVSLKNIRFGMRPAKWQNNLAFPAYGHRIRNFLQSFSFRYGSSFLPELAGVSARSATVPSSKNGGAWFSINSNTKNAGTYKALGYTQSYAELLKTGKQGNWYDPLIQGSITPAEYSVDLMLGPPTDIAQNPAYVATGAAVPYTFAEFDDIYKVVPPLGKFYNHVCGKFIGGLDLRLSTKDVVSGIDTNGLLVRLNGTFDDENLANMVNAVLDVYAEHDAFVQIIPGVATTVTF